MELKYPTHDEIMEFFRDHHGFISVLRVSELLVAPRSNVQDVEWKHVRGVLHELKSQGFLLVEGEGKDIYQEKFSSTPEVIKKYFDRKINPPVLTRKSRRSWAWWKPIAEILGALAAIATIIGLLVVLFG